MNKPRVCFVTPPSAFLLDERVFPNLGVLKVAAALRARGYPVEHLDLDGVANYEETAAIHATQGRPDVFALTATTPQMPAAARIARAVASSPHAPRLIIGGPHATLAAAAAKKHSPRAQVALEQLRSLFSVVVAGDGEDAIEDALRAPDGTVIDADNPRADTGLFLTRKRLDELPLPARDLVDLSSYHYAIDGVPATTLIAQLGCPFACAFCGGRASPMLRRARSRSTDKVLAEMELLYLQYGYLGYMLYDDELNVNPDMVGLMKGIVDLQRRHGVEFRLRGFVKAELLTQEQADVMYRAGFRVLLCGFEAGHPRILDNINKKATVEDNDRACSYARNAGLKIKALMSIGHAGESAETIEATKQWLLNTRPDDFDCTIITPYPGSPYYDDAVRTDDKVWTYTAPRSGDRLHATDVDYTQEADYYKGAPGGGYVSHVFTDHISPVELVRLRDELEADVRSELKIPFNAGAAAIRYEHSMGQPGPLPSNILRRSNP